MMAALSGKIKQKSLFKSLKGGPTFRLSLEPFSRLHYLYGSKFKYIHTQETYLTSRPSQSSVSGEHTESLGAGPVYVKMCDVSTHLARPGCLSN